MREILFRGKRERDGKWVCGSLICDYDIDLYMIDGYEYIPSGKSEVRNPFSVIVDIETVGQYTGLKDRNGTKIFEGDILRTKSVIEYCAYVCYCEDCYVVFDNDGFVCELSEILENTGTIVVGNIHDNPELLKGAMKDA